MSTTATTTTTQVPMDTDQPNHLAALLRSFNIREDAFSSEEIRELLTDFQRRGPGEGGSGGGGGGGGGPGDGGGPPGPPGPQGPQIPINNPRSQPATLEDLIAILNREEGGIAKPQPFKGDPTKSEDFVHQCEMYFLARPRKYTFTDPLDPLAADKQKIWFANALMEDDPKAKKQARRWATLRERFFVKMGWTTWDNYKNQFLDAFKPPNAVTRADQKLERLRADQFDNINDYNIEFMNLIGEINPPNYNHDVHYINLYRRGLSKLVARFVSLIVPDGSPLESWMTTARDVANKWKDDEVMRGGRQEKDPNAMDVDALKFEQKPRRQNNLKCYACEGKGHIARECPTRAREGGQRGQRGGRGNRDQRGRGQRGQGRGGNWRNQTNIRSTEAPAEEEKDVRALAMKLSPDEFEKLMDDYCETNKDFHA